MKSFIESIRRNIARIRRNPDIAPTMISISLEEIASALETLDERMTKIEAAQAQKFVIAIPTPKVADFAIGVPNLSGAPTCTRAPDADWSVGAKF